MGPPPASGPTPLLPPMYASAPPAADPRRSLTYRAVDQIRSGITLYLFVPLLSLVNALVITAVILATNAYVVGNFGGSGLGGVVESNAPAIAITGELVGIIALILTIIAWVTWRRGVRELVEGAGEFGAKQAAAARKAQKDYSSTVYMFLATLVFAIVAAVVVVAVVLGTILHDVNSGQSDSTAAANALSADVGVLVGVALITILLTVLLYHFATRSLVGAVASIAAPGTVARLQRARMIILLGAVLAVLAEAALASRYLYPLAILGPLFLVLGFAMMRSAYSEWLQAPPALTGIPGLSQGFVVPGSFPPPPPPS
jgi:hypothetical protein